MNTSFTLRTPFNNVLRNMIRYAYLLKNKSDGQDNQVAEIGFYGTKIQSRIIWPYGLSGLAPRGSTMLNMILNGQAQNNACIPTYPQERRRNMKEWEFATGNYKTKAETFYDDNGDLNVLAPNGNVNIIAAKDVNVNCVNLTASATAQTTITSPTITLDGDVTITGNSNVMGNSDVGGTLKNNGQDVGGTHTHGGVQTGSGTSGGPNS